MGRITPPNKNREKVNFQANRKMDINSEDEPSSIFRLFTPRTASKENGNINKTSENSSASPSNQLNNDDFDDCSQLPDGLKKCVSAELIGRPLADPFYGNKETFIVVNKNKQLFRFSSTNALGIFSPTSALRSNVIRILTHPFYAIFMVLVILAFCIIHAAGHPPVFDLRYFLIIFLLEFLLKISSHGLLLSPFSYLRNGWNILDVVLNILLLCGTPYLAELRILKIISYSLNLRNTIRLYWSSCKLLKGLMIYMAFMLAILSTLFLQMYMGTLTQACVQNDHIFKLNDEVKLCGNSSGSQACPDSYVCIQGKTTNPDLGYTNFDSIFGSFLSTFRLITRDFWEDLLHFVLATSGPWHILSFIVIIFIISYQVLSLIWGQIAMSYNYLRLERWEQKLTAEDVDGDDGASEETEKDKDVGCCSKTQRFFFFIIYNPFVVLFVIICIILNTLFMALDHHDMSIELEKVLRVANYIFVLVFVIEAILKLLALGVVRYFKDQWNTFDFVVTVLGAVELLLEGIQGLSVFRSFRLLRPLRLGKIVPAFDLILTRMQHLFSIVSGQTIIFFMGIYIFTVFGCHQFGHYYLSFNYDAENDEIPLWRFTDIFHSFMVIFRALCGEWIETMFLCLQVLTSNSSRTICFIYYFLLVTVSSFQIMHIFTALLFTNDDSTAISTKKAQKSQQKPREKFQLQPFLKEKLLEPSVKRIYDEYQPKNDIEALSEHSSAKMVSKAVVEDEVDEAIDNTDTSIPIQSSTNVENSTLKNKKSQYFQHCVTACVIAASLTLTAGRDDDHAESDSKIAIISIYLEFLFIGLLSIELVTKVIARGWKLCVTDLWYWVDLFNIIFAVAGMFAVGKAVHVLTCLRPLSLVSRWNGLNVIANAILKQMWFLTNTLLVCLAFWLIFAIMGVQLFAGKFYSCVDGNHMRVESVHNRTQCEANDRYFWQNSFMNFNDVIDSYYSLLQVSTFKGWIGIIDDAVDSREIEAQPMKEVNIYLFLYFVIFIACGVFVCVNVIVGMLVQHMIHFGSLSELLDRSKTKSAKANGAVGTEDKEQTSDSNNQSNSKLVNFVRSHAFENIALASYVVYILVLMLDHYNMVAEMSQPLQYIDLVLVILLIVEIVLRAFAYRKEYFASSWNRFDVVLVIFVVIELLLSDITSKYLISPALLRVLRIFRFNGLIASFSKTLQRCGKIISRTWNTVSMLYVLLFLVICVYALIGVVLFEDKVIEFGSVDIINFKNFGHSLILMIQLSTASGWDGILAQLSTDENRTAPTLYMLSFLYISFTILLNVMLVIAFEFYKEVTQIEDERKQLPSDDVNDFNEKWKRFAQNNYKYLPKNRISDFFKSLEESSVLRPAEFDEKEFELLGINTNKDGHYSGSTLLVALNRIRLNKQQ